MKREGIVRLRVDQDQEIIKNLRKAKKVTKKAIAGPGRNLKTQDMEKI